MLLCVLKLGILNQDVYLIVPFLSQNETHFTIRTGRLTGINVTDENELVFIFNSVYYDTKIFEREFGETFFFDKQEAYKKLRTIKGWIIGDEDN